jgi:hypothetical protein
LVLIYGFQKDWRGFFWSLVVLVFLVLIMLGIRAKQHFWDGEVGTTPTARPELYAHGVMMGPLIPGQPETVLVGLGNRGNATARNICLGGGNHIFTKSDFAGPLVYKHVPAQVRPDIGPGDKEENSLISASTQPLSKGQIKQLESGEVLFFHFAEGEYTDDDGNSYPIDYCYMFNPRSPTVMGVCPKSIGRKAAPKDGEFLPLISCKRALALKRASSGRTTGKITFSTLYGSGITYPQWVILPGTYAVFARSVATRS